LAPAPSRRPGFARSAHRGARRIPVGRRADAGSDAGAEAARRTPRGGARRPAVRSADGDRAARNRRSELRGNRVLARRRDRHRQIAPDARAPGPAPRAARREDGMKPLTCTATRRRLQAFHDNELDVTNQIGVASHLEWCDACAASLRDLQTIRSTLVGLAPRAAALTHEEAAAFNRAILGRLKVEHDVSFFVRARAVFDDLHFVYAGAGAALAAVFCV